MLRIPTSATKTTTTPSNVFYTSETMSKYSLCCPNTDVTTRLIIAVFLKNMDPILNVEESTEVTTISPYNAQT
jgi:hypothetical protein